MTYDITFVRRPAARTLPEVLEDRDAAFDPDAEPEPLNLSDEQRGAWGRIVDRITQEVGPVTWEEFPFYLTLWRDAPGIRLALDYDGESADLAAPFWYPGEAALPVIAEAYRIAAIVEDETGLEGYDGQVEQPTATGDPALSAARLGGIARWARENLAGAGADPAQG